jgi:hypothetical protein
MGVGGQRQSPGGLPLGRETGYLLHRRLGGPQGRSGRFDPQTVQQVSRPTLSEKYKI